MSGTPPDRAGGGGKPLKPEGPEGILKAGHRAYVGGLWEEIGALQFEFLVGQGLQPAHCFLDIACGSLRGGVHFIRYLDRGHYLGIDKEAELIELGIQKELGAPLFEEKAPEFVVSAEFEFERFSKKPHYSLAQSLFTHLAPSDIRLCLKNLARFVEPGHVLYATFSEGSSGDNPETSHSRALFRYSPAEMEAFGGAGEWRFTYIGSWNHPRDQRMLRYERA